MGELESPEVVFYSDHKEPVAFNDPTLSCVAFNATTDHKDVAQTVQRLRQTHPHKNLHVFTGVHGSQMGNLVKEEKFYRQDVAMQDQFHNVYVHDMSVAPDTDEDGISLVGWCHSHKCDELTGSTASSDGQGGPGVWLNGVSNAERTNCGAACSRFIPMSNGKGVNLLRETHHCHLCGQRFAPQYLEGSNCYFKVERSIRHPNEEVKDSDLESVGPCDRMDLTLQHGYHTSFCVVIPTMRTR